MATQSNLSSSPLSSPQFPVWLNLKQAMVNKCFIDVPYTKIKSQPCQMILDQVVIIVETIENFRENTNYFNRLSLQSNGKYGLGERIIDGLKVKIDSVEIHFTSSAFTASLSLLQISVESRSPNFKPVDNLSQTKIKDTNRNQLLIFKHIEWASLRFESKGVQAHSSPLRLITRNGSCRVTLKKSLLDCSTISARVQLEFDDLLWILTDATVLSFIQLLNYIGELMNKAPMTKKNLENQTSPSKGASQKKNLNVTDIGTLFSRYDVIETSMHLMIKNLQLHLSDEMSRSSFSSLQNGGGLHVILKTLVIDVYPTHRAIASRQHWLRYTDASMNREPFVNEHLRSFFKIDGESSAKHYSNLFTNNSNASEMEKRLKELLAFVILVRVGDYKINCVSTSQNDRKGKKFSKDEHVLVRPGAIPRDLPAIYLEISQYYSYEPGSTRISTRKKSPAPTMFVNIAPSFINFDIVTFLWLNAFYSSIHKSLLKLASTLPQTEIETEFQVLTEIILPTFSINLKNLYNEDDAPANAYEALEIKSTKISIKNSKAFDDNEKLDSLYSKLKLSKLFSNPTQEYPWISGDYAYDCERLMDGLRTASQYLIVNCQPFWCDLKQANRPNSTLIEPFDLTLWMQINKDSVNKERAPDAEPNLNVYCCFPDLKLHLDHDGYLFLIRLLEQIDYFSNILKSDFTRINDQQVGVDMAAPLVLIATVLPHIELFIQMKNHSPEEGESLLKNDQSFQSNLSDKSSFLLSEEDAPKKEDCFFRPLNTPTTDPLSNGVQLNSSSEPLNSSNDPLSDRQSDGLSSAGLSQYGNLSIGNGNAILVENIEEETIEVTTNASTNPFVGIFSNRNGYTSISNMSVNTSLIEEDTRSIKSDLSVESERVVFNLEDDLDSFAFRSTDNEDNENIEEGVEMTETLMKCEADEYRPIDRTKRPDLISYLKMTLRNVSFLNQNQNFISSILASVQELELDSHFAVPYSQFEKDCRSTLDLFRPVNYASEANLKARVDTDTRSVSNNKEHKEMISAVLQGVDLKVLDKRFIDCVSEFLLDGDAVDVSRIKILIDGIRLKLNDEMLKTPIMNVHLNGVLVDRNANNEIQIGPYRGGPMKSGAHPFLAAHRALIDRCGGGGGASSVGDNAAQPANYDDEEFTREDYLRLLEENRKLKAQLNGSL